MFNKYSERKNKFMLNGRFAKKGYDWWWHTVPAVSEETGKPKVFFVEYFVVNPGLGKKEPVFGQLPKNQKKKIRPSYIMVNVGSWGEGGTAQLHRFFGWKEKGVKVKKGAPFYVKAGDCYCDEKVMRGSVHISAEDAAAHPEWMSDAGDLEWDIKIKPKVAWNVGFATAAPMRALKLLDMAWHSNGMLTKYTGTITFNGEKFKVATTDTSNGYQDKNWGRDFTSPWMWLSSSHLTDNKTGKQLKDTIFNIGGGRPSAMGIPVGRILLGCFYKDGKEYEFNFSKVWTLARSKYSFEELDDKVVWHARLSNRKYIMTAEIECEKENTTFWRLENPKGQKRMNHLWNSGCAHGDVVLYKKRRFRKDKVLADVHAVDVGVDYGEYDA